MIVPEYRMDESYAHGHARSKGHGAALPGRLHLNSRPASRLWEVLTPKSYRLGRRSCTIAVVFIDAASTITAESYANVVLALRENVRGPSGFAW